MVEAVQDRQRRSGCSGAEADFPLSMTSSFLQRGVHPVQDFRGASRNPEGQKTQHQHCQDQALPEADYHRDHDRQRARLGPSECRYRSSLRGGAAGRADQASEAKAGLRNQRKPPDHPVQGRDQGGKRHLWRPVELHVRNHREQNREALQGLCR